MWTAPVPVSIVTKSAVNTIASRSRNGWRALILSIFVPGNDASGSPIGSNFVFAQNCGTSLSASKSFSEIPPRENSWTTYNSFGSTAIARLAGNVHGVVVQIAIDVSGGKLTASPTDSGTIGNLTYTAVSSRSWYSISASASAVCAPVL